MNKHKTAEMLETRPKLSNIDDVMSMPVQEGGDLITLIRIFNIDASSAR